MILVNQLSKRYNDQLALDSVTIEFPANSSTVLIGPSGCGKSTLLRTIVGLITPTSGELLFDGRPVTTDNVEEIRRQTGYVIQEGGLFPHLSAKDNVLLMARFLKVDRAHQEQRLKELCELTHFQREHLNKYPTELSGGLRQRVSLMRALMLDPKVLLLDEPLGALDPFIRSSLQEELKTIFQQLKKTVVFVTHDMAEAAFFGDYIALLNEGRLAQLGSFEELSKTPANEFVTRFINSQRRLPTA
jgi:osmoprotectant transport system ATP-binding protein